MSPALGTDVAIIGVGARTPLGLTADASAAAVRGAISVIREHPYFVDKAGEPMKMTRDAALAIDLSGTERCLELARSALSQAVGPLIDHHVRVGVIPTFVGLPEARPGRSADLERLLTSDLMATASPLGVSLDVQTISYGHSAGLMALEAALKRFHSGEADLCLIGGVDSYIDGETLEWLDQNKQLMSGVNRSGFPPGEAAGFCLVASSSFVRRTSLHPLARVVSASTTVEKNRIKTDTICVGEGLTAAIRGACAALEPAKGRVEQTWCDMNGERYRSTEYTYTLLRAQSLFVKSHVSHPADCWGDVGAASGPLFIGLAIESWSRSYAKGPRALLWTSSECGYRAAAVLQRANDGGEPAR
jgi:3-oxoacyl-[acyl-carrier-protein] synthase-1